MQPVSVLKQIVLVAVLVGVGVLSWFERDRLLALASVAPAQFDERGRDRRAGGPPVITQAVREMRDDLVLEVVGTGRARRSVMLRATGSGEIVTMPLETQRWFPADAILMELDATAEALALQLAQARLAEAERAFDRLTRLSNSGSAAKARLEETETAAAIARLQVEQAREEFADRTLRAPFRGVPGLPAVEAGAWVDEGDVIASFDDRREILVEFEFPETALWRLRLGAPVTARTPSAPGRSFDGEVVALDSRLDANSRTALVRVALPNPDDALRPGASFTVRLELPGDVHPAVPDLAVQFSRGDVYVWRVVDGAAERVEARLIGRRDGQVLLDGPLRPGDRVVVEGAQRLSPGRAVTESGREAGATS